MKRNWLAENEEHFPRPPTSLHARFMAMAGPSSGGMLTAIPATSRKHGWGHFSLRRLFGTNPLSRRTIRQHRPAPMEVDLRSESGFVSNTIVEPKNPASLREAFRLTAIGHSSSDSESNSLSLGHSDSRHDSSVSGHHGGTTGSNECPLCLLELPPNCFPELSSCHHHACYECLQQYLRIEISESRVNISCPECTEPIHPNDIRMILNDEVMLNKYENFMLRRVLVTEPDARWCPAPDCGYVVIASGCASCPKLKCEWPGCDTFFCYHCKQEWHPNQTCDSARAQRANNSPNLRSASVSFSHDSIVQRGDIKSCPCCKVFIIKMDDGSCNHMTCSVCGTEFCWLCMKEISDLHYLSPSGCTFWGKKPWSRKKKILWQLGMLVGAPVGIALIAGIAVPAIIIGIPVWVGRKIYDKYTRHTGHNKHKRNLAITGGVLASVLVSPVLAGIAVGIGVPILLAYVYGVVPISLCRSGGCGVSTSPSGVRFDFDEENDIGKLSQMPMAINFDEENDLGGDGVSMNTDASNRGVDPSIGEVSCGMSTSISMGSGSHLERVGLIRDRDSDRESASNTAIAGHSLTGSITSASLGGNAAHKVEVQADVASTKRFSLSSHSETASATVSLSERSANMSLADDASTRALAGSLLGYRDATSAITPVEVHVDAHLTMEEAVANTLQMNCDVLQSEGIAQVEDSTDGSITPCCCSYEEEAYAARTTRVKWRKTPTRWQPGSHGTVNCIPENRMDLNIVGGVDDDEALTPLEMAQFQDFGGYCATFIDENLSIGDYNEEQNSVRFRDEVQTIGSSSIYEQNCLSNGTNNTAGLQLKSFRSNLAVDSSQDLRVPVHESRSLDQLMTYCDFCQKVHRPCCPNAYMHDMFSSVRIPIGLENPNSPDENNTVALANEPNFSSSNQVSINESLSAKKDHNKMLHYISFEPIVIVHAEHKYSGPQTSRSYTTVYEHDRPSSTSRWTPVSSLPHVEEPEFHHSSNPQMRPRSAPYFLYVENEEISLDPDPTSCDL